MIIGIVDFCIGNKHKLMIIPQRSLIPNTILTSESWSFMKVIRLFLVYKFWFSYIITIDIDIVNQYQKLIFSQ